MNGGGKESMTVPFACAYWVVAGKFLAGCYPGSRDKHKAYEKLKALLDHGIRHVINLTERDERDWDGRPFEPYEEHLESIASSMGHRVTFDRMPIRDTWIPSRIEMSQILDCIDACVQDGTPVYLHCWGGRGRTGTVVGCFLARHGMGSGDDLLKRIQALRKHTEDCVFGSPETSYQADFVRSWLEAE